MNDTSPVTSLVAGIFVGGQGSRMGGVAKGLLRGPNGSSPLEHWLQLFAELSVSVVLIGSSEPYRDLNIQALADEPSGVGPLGGLIALCRHVGSGRVLVVACDMPWVSPKVLHKLIHTQPEAPLLAASHQGQWQPFFARYDVAVLLPIAQRCLTTGKRALHHVLTEGKAVRMELDGEELRELRDWDTHDDVVRDGGPW